MEKLTKNPTFVGFLLKYLPPAFFEMQGAGMRLFTISHHAYAIAP